MVGAGIYSHPDYTVRGLWTPQGPKDDEGAVLWDLSHGTRPRYEFPVYKGNVLVDLSEITGRLHLAWTVREHARSNELGVYEREVITAASRGESVDPKDLNRIGYKVLVIGQG